jgi:endonuclease/exonuclease/phosphatase family metal-dependent hydrolase
MPTKLRVATYNVENLFTRAKVLNFADNATGDAHLDDINKLRIELRRTAYDKATILALYGKVKEFIEIVEVREKLFNRSKTKVVADGVTDWSGFIRFKRAKFSQTAQKNTGKVIRDMDADILCLVEIENRPALKQFASERLTKTTTFDRYKFFMCIDGNDDRGIDVAIASRFPIRDLRSHVDDEDEAGEVFSRDCLEVRIEHPTGDIWMLLNHFKSKGFTTQAEGDGKRERQAKRVAKILKKTFDLTKERVIVCGDLNDTPTSTPLKPLAAVKDLTDIFDTAQTPVVDRWTYHFKKNEQIDYLLLSKPLTAALSKVEVFRRGIFEVEKFSAGTITPYGTVKQRIDSASDHAAVCAEFSV